MKVKEESDKVELNMSGKKTNIMTAEETQNLSVDDEHIEIVKDFAHLASIIN